MSQKNVNVKIINNKISDNYEFEINDIDKIKA